MATAHERFGGTDTDRLSLRVSAGSLLALTLVVGGLRLAGQTIPLRAQAGGHLVGVGALHPPHGG